MGVKIWHQPRKWPTVTWICLFDARKKPNIFSQIGGLMVIYHGENIKNSIEQIQVYTREFSENYHPSRIDDLMTPDLHRSERHVTCTGARLEGTQQILSAFVVFCSSFEVTVGGDPNSSFGNHEPSSGSKYMVIIMVTFTHLEDQRYDHLIWHDDVKFRWLFSNPNWNWCSSGSIFPKNLA